MGERARARAAFLVVSAALAVLPGVPRAQTSGAPRQDKAQPRVNAEAALAAEFTKRVAEYVALHNKVEGSLPRLSKDATPDQIDKHQRELGRLIMKARASARVGDIFTKEIRAYFRRQIAAAFAGPEGRALKSSIMDENPGPIRLAVNGRYPDSVPLATMPPQVLAQLPRLPEDLEYRFIASRLILLDVHAHIIVDYIDDALPD